MKNFDKTTYKSARLVENILKLFLTSGQCGQDGLHYNKERIFSLLF